MKLHAWQRTYIRAIQLDVKIFIKTIIYYDNNYYCSFAVNRYRSLKTFGSSAKINCFATRSNRKAIHMTGNRGRGSASLQLFSDFRRVSSITSQSCVRVIFLFYTLYIIVGWEKKLKPFATLFVACYHFAIKQNKVKMKIFCSNPCNI